MRSLLLMCVYIILNFLSLNCTQPSGLRKIPLLALMLYLFKHLTSRSMKFILHCLNILWSDGSVPDQWRRSIVIPVLKKGKDSKHAASYRPISLTPCFFKIHETIVCRYRFNADGILFLCAVISSQLQRPSG
jgi:hypothetical protein